MRGAAPLIEVCAVVDSPDVVARARRLLALPAFGGGEPLEFEEEPKGNARRNLTFGKKNTHFVTSNGITGAGKPNIFLRSEAAD